MKKIVLLLLVVLCLEIVQPINTYANEEALELYAQSAVLMDADSGRILYSKNGYEAKANASTTKILTCILALEYGELDQIVSASARAKQQPAVHMGVLEGEQYVLKDLLYALMLESYNDSAVMIAEAVSGSVEEFSLLMNNKANEIGCEDTYFITPNGLDDENEVSFHHTTANDLSLIMRYCIMISEYKELFLEITRTSSYTFQSVDGTRSFTCSNHNSLLTMMDDALSGKTGFTNDAGYCYVGAIENEGRTFIIALLGCGWPYNSSYKWSDASQLVNYAKENYFYQTISSDQYIGNASICVPVLYGKTLEDEQFTNLQIDFSDDLNILLSEKDEVSIVYQYPNTVVAPMEEKTVVGYVNYLLNGQSIKIDTISINEAIEPSDFKWRIYKKLTNTFLR
ncbi:MAG: D-alanyl-D-alanine carboxypeptidase family protein [Eubacteriales bacterium]